MESASAGRPHPFRAFRSEPARLRLGRVPFASGRYVPARPVGAGADGDPRKRADLPAGSGRGLHPCRGTRRPSGAVGDGGGGKMLRPLGRDRRSVRRSGRTRFHRHPAARGRFGTKWRALLAGAARRNCEPQRRPDALAAGERAVVAQFAGLSRAGAARLGRRAVPGTRSAAGPLEHRS